MVPGEEEGGPGKGEGIVHVGSTSWRGRGHGARGLHLGLWCDCDRWRGGAGLSGPEIAAPHCIRCARAELSRKQGARLGARRRGAVAALFWCYGALADRRHAPSARWGAVALLCARAP